MNMNIDAMKDALEYVMQQWDSEAKTETIATLQKAIAEAEKAEPVAWQVWRGDAYELFFNRDTAIQRGQCFLPLQEPEPLYTHPQPAQQSDPVAYSVGNTLHWHEGKGVTDAQLYAAPQQAEIDRLKADLQSEQDKRFEGNRIASAEYAEQGAEIVRLRDALTTLVLPIGLTAFGYEKQREALQQAVNKARAVLDATNAPV